METLRSILVPVDGSPPSIAALDHAVALAQDYGARIEVLHVVPPADPLSPSVRAEIDSALGFALDRARQQLGERVAHHTTVGEPVSEILERSRDDIDLIVMGTHGRVGRLHSLLGSVAAGVVRNAPCPVLTVRSPDGGYQSFAERRHGRPFVGERAPAR